MDTASGRPLSQVIETLDTMIHDLNEDPVKTRMKAILITELQKAVAFAREVLKVEGPR